MFSSEQNIFRKVLSLVGKKVELGRRSNGKRVVGVVTNAMFDSLALNNNGTIEVISFSDILFLDDIDG